MASPSPEPTYTRGGKVWPVVSTAANAELRSLLLSKTANIAEAAVLLQLDQWKISETAALDKVRDNGLGELLGVDFDKITFKGKLGDNPELDVTAILTSASEIAPEDVALKKDLWMWERLPYVIRCASMARSGEEDESENSKSADRPAKKTRVQGREELVSDVDEWIICNEKFLRALSRRPNDDWKFGLLRLDQLSVAFFRCATPVLDATGTKVALKVQRSPIANLPGYTVLDAKRAESISVQPSTEAFKRRWDGMTDGVLRNLDWNNVFVAGGIVLGAILTPEGANTHSPTEWLSSDIDMYIHGLSPTLANEKIKHIAETYQANLPSGSPFLVVRNSQTITFYSEWPRRRVQIVLKLVKSPREVLLNFDLDICGCGFDGNEVYLLPRCARTLETGTNIFVMDLINGHYLGDRKATRDKRVFKYANRGFGLRILPSYISSLATYSSATHLAAVARGEKLSSCISLAELASRARKWTSKALDNYIKVGHNNRPFHWHWPQTYPPVQSDKPVFSHAMLESYAQVTSEPLGRSCLTGFSLLMRHVALWEQEIEGKIVIFEDLWATDTYGEGPRVEVAYDDSPAYKWDRTFSIAHFKEALDKHNQHESDVATGNQSKIATARRKAVPPIPAARITYGDSVFEVLQPAKDILIPLILDHDFMVFANDRILAALKTAGIAESDCITPLTLVSGKDDDNEILAVWRLNKILNWQMLDRRIDEIREVLWSFHRANERMFLEDHDRQNFLLTAISKRAIRTTVEDEQEAFVRWVTRQPYHDEAEINAMWWYGELDE
ncbi:hypothetical protein C8J57DRAFT_641477 [Mycena rebaudengoi]|nr:hypothetical protein C8J57DRAFT_641477 [Mycena rebaudengoi]